MITDIERAFRANGEYKDMKIDIIDSLIFDKIIPMLDEMGLVVKSKHNDSLETLSAPGGREQIGTWQTGSGEFVKKHYQEVKEPIPTIVKNKLQRFFATKIKHLCRTCR